MRVRPSTLFLSFILIAALPGLGQDAPNQKSKPRELPTALSQNEDLKKELPRIQAELSQVAQDMDAVDARMMQGITSTAPSGVTSTILKIHEQLKGYNADGTIKAFFDSPRNDARWQLCMKTCKLYTSLFEKAVKTNDSMPGDQATRKVSSTDDDALEAFQCVFVVRTMAELQLRYSELESQLVADPDRKQQELLRRLREALQNDDRTYMEKLNSFCTRTGVSPNDFAAQVGSGTQKTSLTAAAAVVEGMGIVSPEEGSWKLADISGINPDFIRALECDRRATKDFLATGSNAALIQAVNCRRSPEGSYITAFAEKPADQARSNDPTGKTPPNSGGMSQDPGVFPLSNDDITRELLKIKSEEKKAGSQQPPNDTKGAGFSANYPAVSKQKIPSWWIRCECPDDHPDAGIVVDGVRWHAPVLHCPNPEVRRWQVK